LSIISEEQLRGVLEDCVFIHKTFFFLSRVPYSVVPYLCTS
jgi:hypothetical protein